MQYAHKTNNLISNVTSSNKVTVNQKYLGNVLAELFPNEKIVENARNLLSKVSGQRLQLDFWLPALRLAFEFQGPHHYTTAWYSPLSREQWEDKDDSKRSLTEEAGAVIVEVPYWWGGDKESLIATIREKRKDLFSEMEGSALPIPTDAAIYGHYKLFTVPDVGELMNAKFVPNKYFVLTSWWISEKYDGVRACWNSIKSKIFGRWGREIAIEDIFIRRCPKLFMDGEIWFGRGSYQEAHILTERSSVAEMPLEFLRFIVFDTPPLSISSSISTSISTSISEPPNLSLVIARAEDTTPLEERSKLIEDNISLSHPFIIPIANVKCHSKLQLRGFLDDVWKTQGEGLILKGPKSIYAKGNSEEMVKLKVSRDDEGLITFVGKQYVELQMLNGTTHRHTNYPGMPKLEVGDVVTFTYTFSVKGNIYNVRIIRKRPDLRWLDLVHRERKNEEGRNVILPNMLHSVQAGFFSRDDGKNIRAVFEHYAKSNNFDHLVPENWYNVSHHDIIRIKGGAGAMSHCGNSITMAILGTFPDIGLDLLKFKRVPQNYWKNLSNQRTFFIDYAKKRGLDPFKTDTWYNISYREYRKIAKIGSFIFTGMHRILQSAFPDMKFDPLRFCGVVHWRSWHNRKQFFDDLAAHYEFDPLVIDNWYQREKKITAKIKTIGRGRGMIQRYYKNSLQNALQDLYINPRT